MEKERMPLRPQVSPVRVAWAQRRARLGRPLTLLALAAGLSTCGPEADCLTSTGPIVTERRELPTDLLSVYASDNVDLILAQEPPGTAPYLEVRAGQNLQASIETRLDGRALRIGNTARCNWVRSYNSPREVTLHVPRILNVFLYGSGNVSTAGTLRQDTVFFHLTGAGDYNVAVQSNYVWLDLYELGDLTIRGQTNDLRLTLGGNGRFFGAGLRTRVCYFVTNRDSNGDAYVTATEQFGGTIRGNGTLYYGGQPGFVDVKRTGPGRAVAVP